VFYLTQRTEVFARFNTLLTQQPSEEAAMATPNFNSIDLSSPFFSDFFTEFSAIGCVFYALQETHKQILSGKVSTFEEVRELLSELSGLIRDVERKH
jgi:hypothetical protein